MTCDEAQHLQSLYLDSELEARTALEVQQHLKVCPDCARLFAEEQRVEGWLKGALNRGDKKTTLWKQVEAGISAGQSRPRPISGPARSRKLLAAMRDQLRGSSSGSRWVWAGLAAAWAVILVLNTTARDVALAPSAARRAPSTAEMRFALKQKQLLMVELAVPSVSAINLSKAPPVGPRTERPRRDWNT